jgi:HlyD family secretion protein
MSAEELAKLGGEPLKPGMPVETFVQTGERSPISFLLKPLSDQLAHVFRER